MKIVEIKLMGDADAEVGMIYQSLSNSGVKYKMRVQELTEPHELPLSKKFPHLNTLQLSKLREFLKDL